MKILMLTFYYPPDLSAGSYRAAALVDALVEFGGGDMQVDIVTTTPNRYASYAGGSTTETGRHAEQVGGVNVIRIPIPPHRSGILDQSRCFVRYAAGVMRKTQGRKYDIVFATTSRLLTGSLGALMVRRTGAKLYLDIRDVFVETIADLLRTRRIASTLLLPMLEKIERYTLSKASGVNLVSAEFKPYFARRYPDLEFANFSNGVDTVFLDFDYRTSATTSVKTILYAGNIGFGQGLERVLPQAALRLGRGYRIRVIGDGGRLKALQALVASSGVENIELLPPVSRDQLRQEYRAADVLLLHLNDVPALDRVLPSKLFEYAATGKPIVAGVRGYAKEFIEREVPNAFVFEPCQPSALVAAVSNVSLGHTDRNAFTSRYLRDSIMRSMADDVVRINGTFPGARGERA